MGMGIVPYCPIFPITAIALFSVNFNWFWKHHEYVVCSTGTGRLSLSNPELSKSASYQPYLLSPLTFEGKYELLCGVEVERVSVVSRVSVVPRCAQCCDTVTQRSITVSSAPGNTPILQHPASTAHFPFNGKFLHI